MSWLPSNRKRRYPSPPARLPDNYIPVPRTAMGFFLPRVRP